MDLSVRDWEAVAAAPVIVFVLVAFADRKLSDSEKTTFFDSWLPRLMDINIAPDEQAKRIYKWNVEEDALNMKRITSQTAGALLEQLSDTFTMLNDGVASETLQSFRKELAALALDVANAAGGFLMFVDPISEDEEKMLAKIKHAMRGRPTL